MSEIAERLNWFADQKGLMSKDLADAASVKKQTVSDYLSGKTAPSAKALGNWSKNFGLNVDWLLTGEGEPSRQKNSFVQDLRPKARPEPAPQVCPSCSSDFAGHIVDVHSTIGAGPAREHWEPEPLRQVCIPERFYWPGVLVIQVEGSSMEPLIRKGAFVGLDTAQTWIVAGEIYAVHVPYEGLTLKRVFVDPENDRLRLQSENPRHPEQTVAIEGREGLVVGKAIWVMQEI